MTDIVETPNINNTLDQSSGKPIAKRRRWRTLLALSMGYFVDQGEGQAMSIFSPVLKTLWSLTNMNLAWITFIRSLLQSLSSPFWGYLSDRYSRKKVLLIGTGLWGIWTIIVGLTQSYEQLLLIRVISGIGLGCLMPATFSIMADTFPPKVRGKNYCIHCGIGIPGNPNFMEIWFHHSWYCQHHFWVCNMVFSR
jgi:MFS family permease